MNKTNKTFTNPVSWPVSFFSHLSGPASSTWPVCWDLIANNCVRLQSPGRVGKRNRRATVPWPEISVCANSAAICHRYLCPFFGIRRQSFVAFYPQNRSNCLLRRNMDDPPRRQPHSGPIHGPIPHPQNDNNDPENKYLFFFLLFELFIRKKQNQVRLCANFVCYKFVWNKTVLGQCRICFANNVSVINLCDAPKTTITL